MEFLTPVWYSMVDKSSSNPCDSIDDYIATGNVMVSWKFSAILKKDRCQVFRGNLHCPLQILTKYQYRKCRFSPSVMYAPATVIKKFY